MFVWFSSKTGASLEEPAKDFPPPTKLKFSITPELEERIHEASAEFDS